MMRFGLSKSYVDTLKNEVLPEGGMALAGGAVGGLAFGMLQGTKFFQELMVKKDAAGAVVPPGTPDEISSAANKLMIKKLALAAILGIGGGSGLWMAGDYGVNAAKGLMGAMGATMAAVVWNKMAKPAADAAAYVQGTYPMQLQGTRVHQGALPGIGNINVRQSTQGAHLMAVLAAQ
ncbi:MAG: hypothetical protein ABIK89_15315 [Planctomycetota bacterium]